MCGLASALFLAMSPARAAPSPSPSVPIPAPAAIPGSPCAADGPVQTPPGWRGWDRSGVVAWEAIEQAGGVVPDIEEDRTQSPPAWWRTPSPVASALLLDAESRNPRWGLYQAVTAAELAKGDILVRPHAEAVGSACGKMAVLAVLQENSGSSGGKWGTLEIDDEGRGAALRVGSPLFFAADGKTPLPGVRLYRIRVKKEDTIGHLRELRRDLRHLERTIGDAPAMLAVGEGAEDVVAEKIHDLIDEAWSLVAEEAYDLDRRVLAARGYALGAALGWPAAIEAGLALVDDVLARAPARAEAWVAHGVLAGLRGDPGRALGDAREALGRQAGAGAGVDEGDLSLEPPELPARWLEVRALLAMGNRAEGGAALERFSTLAPGDRRAVRMRARLRAPEPTGSHPTRPSAAPAPGLPTAVPGAVGMSPIAVAAVDGITYFASPERVGFESRSLGFRVSWPLTWRVSQLAASPAAGVLATLSTGRALLDDGRAERASAVVLAQKPLGPVARAALVRDGVRKLFPTAKLKTLPPLLPGSRRSQFRDQQPEGTRVGEVVTLERAGVVLFLVLNASPELYPKLGDDYATFVRSLTFPPS
jgi:hypothetical protein